jgi:hypothetical protein
MAKWRDAAVPAMPADLASFRAVDWLDADAVEDAEFDVWESRRYYARPVTADPAVLAGYQAFLTARAEWEAAHPEWVRAEVAAMVARRLERAARWAGWGG